MQGSELNDSFSQLRATSLSIQIEPERQESFQSSPSFSMGISPSRVHLSPQLLFNQSLNPVVQESPAPNQDEPSEEEDEDDDSIPPIQRAESSFQFVLRNRIHRARVVRVPAYGRMLYTRNHVAICRGIFFGIFSIAPFTALFFLQGFSLSLKACVVALQVFGVMDVLVFFAYEDKLNDMFLSGALRKYPRGCRDHSTIGFIMSLLHLGMVGGIVFFMFTAEFLEQHFILMMAFVGVSMLYFMSLCTLKASIAYLVILATLVWLVMATITAVVALLALCLTCGKIILGKKQKLAHQKCKFISAGLIKQLRERQGNDLCCSVCLDGLRVGDKVLELPCSRAAPHIFHYKCGSQWLAQHHTCPMCRKDYESSESKKSVWERLWLYRDIDV